MFILHPDDTVPLYHQLYQQIRELVLSGKLPAHGKLPSVRDLAAELSVGRNTVEGAYQELLAEGYVYSRARSGYFVSALDHELPISPQSGRSGKPIQPQKTSAVCRYDFHPARLDPFSFPLAKWRSCFLESLANSATDLMAYGDPLGDWALRTNLQIYLHRSRGVLCSPEQIVVCAGLQHGLDLLAQLLKPGHQAIGVENPGYHLPRAVFRNQGYAVVPLSVGPTGLDPARLERSGCSLVYVTPSHQMPLGGVMPIANRLKLIEWAEAAEHLIIEDDYDSELRYHGKPIPSLQGLRPEGNIVYLGTFSKVLAPALRLSYMVLPAALVPRFRAKFRDYFSPVSLLEQRCMAKFMAEGHWQRHIRRMRISYQKRHDALLQSLARHFGELATVVGQGAGLHLVLQLHDRSLAEADILQRAAKVQVGLFPASVFWAQDGPDAPQLLLGFGGLAVEEIERGVALLAEAIKAPHSHQVPL